MFPGFLYGHRLYHRLTLVTAMNSGYPGHKSNLSYYCHLAVIDSQLVLFQKKKKKQIKKKSQLVL